MIMSGQTENLTSFIGGLQHLPELGILNPADRDVGVLFQCCQELPEREIRNIVLRSFPGESKVTSFDVVCSIVRPVARLIQQNNGCCLIAGKVYKEYSHGILAEEQVFWMDPLSMKSDLHWIGLGFGTDRIVCTAISGVIRIDDKFYFIPTIDLEFPCVNDRLKYLAVKRLREIGMTGYLINSGYGCHFIADLFLPYDSNYWGILGLVMKHLVYDYEADLDTIANSIMFGERLLEVQTQEQALTVANEILDEFPSLPSGMMRAGLLYDPRWIGHRLEPSTVGDVEIAINTLRVNRVKGYDSLPFFDLVLVSRN